MARVRAGTLLSDDKSFVGVGDHEGTLENVNICETFVGVGVREET